MSSDESDAPGGADDRFVLEGAVERKWPDHGRGRYFDRLMDLVQTRPPPRDDGGGAEVTWKAVGDRVSPDDAILARDYSLEPPHVDGRFEPMRPLPPVGGASVKVHYALSEKRARRLDDGERRRAILAARAHARQLHSPIVLSKAFQHEVPRWQCGRDFLQNRAGGG